MRRLGSGLLAKAINAGSDAFITADVKYHAFFEAAGRILLIDAGHFETEKFAQEILYDLIVKKFPKFALRFQKQIRIRLIITRVWKRLNHTTQRFQ